MIRNPVPNDSFQCAIPMRHIFAFVEDYSKLTYGMRDKLQFIRKDDNDALFWTRVVIGKITPPFLIIVTLRIYKCA